MKLSIVITLFTVVSQYLWAYPEMIRHGYPNCITCHYSTNGGGLVTPYGRTLSQEVLSTWHTEGESDFLWGLVKTPEGFSLGGDLRLVQTRIDSPTYKAGRFIVMQADLEAAANYNDFGVVATLGKAERTGSGNFAENFMSRRHFVTYHPNQKEELYFRAGRFQKAFGINVSDHIISTKRGLGWDYGSETYNVEAAWIGEKFDAFLTGNFGRPDKPELNIEKGIAARGGYNFSTHKTGLSYFYGSNDRAKRHVYGPYGMMGITKRLFVLGEVDLQNYLPTTGSNLFGFAQYLRLDYELMQGLHIFLAEDFLRNDFKEERTISNSYGVGLQFFPRPHFEWVASYQKQRLMAASSSYNDYFWLMFHYYP